MTQSGTNQLARRNERINQTAKHYQVNTSKSTVNQANNIHITQQT